MEGEPNNFSPAWVQLFSTKSDLGNTPYRHDPFYLHVLQKLLHLFQAGDLALADRGFSSYALLGLLLLRGAHSLFRLHHARSSDLRRGKRLGKNDRLMLWRRP